MEQGARAAGEPAGVASDEALEAIGQERLGSNELVFLVGSLGPGERLTVGYDESPGWAGVRPRGRT